MGAAMAILLFQTANSGGAWFVVGLLCGMVAGWMMKPVRSEIPSPFVECTQCHEPIRAGSTVCKHCHSKQLTP